MDQDFLRLILSKEAGKIFRSILLFSISRHGVSQQLIKIRKKLKMIRFFGLPTGKPLVFRGNLK
jgi:hypothetical protein